MEEVNITELEARHYLDLFSRCDIEKTGKVPVLKATEMFRSADVPNDILKHIMSLASIPQTALHMSKVQFYSCLKLIAAHQNAIPLRQEMIASTITLPPPKFSWKESPLPLRNEMVGINGDMNRWRSSTGHSPNLFELARAERQNDVANSDVTSTDSEVEQNETDNKLNSRRAGSSEAWSTASDSPTPTNSVAERPWVKNALWQGLLCEEQRQLLGTEEESSDRHSSEEDNDADLETVYQITPEQKDYYIKQFRTIQPDIKGLLSGPAAKVFFEKSRIPVEELRHIWQLCDVTKDGALSLGEFAAAMHLVVLRRNNIPLPPILPECLIPSKNTFAIAQPEEADLLHLGDDKPDTTTVQSDATTIPFNNTFVSLQTTLPTKPVRKHSSSSPTTVATIKNSLNNNSNKDSSSSNSPPNDPVDISPTKPRVPAVPKDWINQSSKEWTKFTESPTSNVSSPGSKPANFDMQRTAQAVVSDPQILHPVPLRITPVGAETIDEDTSRMNHHHHHHHRKSENLSYDGGIITIRDAETASPKQQYVQQRDSGLQNDLRAIQRPQPKKILIKNNIGAIPPPPQRESLTAATNLGNTDAIDGANLSSIPPVLHNKKEVPPPPPPRPHRHARSSSLDLNKLKLNAPVPPEVPPRVSPQMTAQISLDAQLETVNSTFADFTQFPESVIEASQNQPISIDTDDSIPIPARASIPSFQSSQRSSAFEVYRKPTPRESISPPESLGAKCSERNASISNERSGLYKNDSKNINDVMRHLREQNMLLMTMCSDLSEELLTVQQKKEEIKAKIDCDGQNGNNFSIGLINSKELGNQSTV